ncbi:MAG: 4'-phosphopantetheinyl transferase superfamily protein [Acidobacteria bacterium]|nr:4'-phosphopantetheinyl transferase superfamily protein [Acidobacteriota bacterium]
MLFWNEPPKCVERPANELHLWRWNCGKNLHWGLELNASELARVDRLRHVKDRQAARQARLGLRWVLGQYMGDPERLTFCMGEHGKPFLTGDPLCFNLSHSREWAGVLVGSRPVGLDIEWVRPRASISDLAHKIFTEREHHAWAGANDPLQVFYQGWTRKEAFFKAVGDGISFGFQQADVDLLADDWTEVIQHKSSRRWWICPLDWGFGYAAALATDRPELPLTCFERTC